MMTHTRVSGSRHIEEMASLGDPIAQAVLDEAMQELLGALMVAVQYLEHPDVQAMPFALPASGAAKRARKAIAKAEGR